MNDDQTTDKSELEKAIERLYSTIQQRNICGAKFDLSREREYSGLFGGSVFDGSWERGWGCGVSLRLSPVETEHNNRPVWMIESRISWPSTGFTVAGALCANTLHREVIELAAYLESQWNEWPPLREKKKPTTPTA